MDMTVCDVQVLEEVKVTCDMDREMLVHVARTSLRTKLSQKVADVLTEVVVDAVLAVQREGEPIDLHMVEVMEMMHRTDTDTRF